MKKIVLCSALLISSATLAQTPTAGQTNELTEDPNETICRTIQSTESRLSRSRVCKTRAEWAELRGATRQGVERSQAGRGARQY